MYQIVYANKRVLKNLKRFSKGTINTIISSFESEASNYPHCKNITWVKEVKMYRWKSNQFRILFSVNKKSRFITVYYIGTRQNFYKESKRK